MIKHPQKKINCNVTILESFLRDIKTSTQTYIRLLRQSGLSYGQIEKRSGVAKGQIFKIEKRDYFPSTQKAQFRIFFRLASLFEIKLKD